MTVLRFVQLPPGALDDFHQIIRVSEVRPVPLRWVHEYTTSDSPPLCAGVTLYEDRVPAAVVGVTKGITFMSRSLLAGGWTEDAAKVVVQRHVLSHEAGHLRQLARGSKPPLNEDEANDWSYVVFRKLGWDVRIVEFLLTRWPPGKLWREYVGAT